MRPDILSSLLRFNAGGRRWEPPHQTQDGQAGARWGRAGETHQIAPQSRALFAHPKFQKRSGAEVFRAFRLQTVLHATPACNFSCLISTLRSEKQVVRVFSTFARILIFFLLPFSSVTFSLLPFSSLTVLPTLLQLSILSEVKLLNFLR